MSYSLSPDQDRLSVSPDLRPYRLQRLSADDKVRASKEPIKIIVCEYLKRYSLKESHQDDTMSYHILVSLICLFDLIPYVPSTIFQLNRNGSSWVEPALS